MILQHDMKQYERAIEIYQEYLDLYPAGESAEVTPICLAKCYVERGEKTKALEILQKGLENLKDTSLEPDYEQKIMELK